MPQWTKAQGDAIEARGGSVLVSAAAGSGKTAVLVERAVRLICDEKQPADADRLLIVTFSNAAAAEMKQRMSARLSGMLREKPGDLFLQRQQALLATAQISTIHSFCLELLRSNFQNLDISHDFSIADENELAVMKNDCAETCVERCYQTGDAAFIELVELLSAGRDDKRLIDTVLKIYDFSRSHPFFEDWLDERLAMYDTGLPVGETIWGKTILRYAADSLKFCLSSARAALDIIEGDERMEKAYGAAFRADIYGLEECLNAVSSGEWDTAVGLISGFSFTRLGQLRGDDTQKHRAKDARELTKSVVTGLAKKYLNATEDDFRLDIEDLRPKIAVLFGLVKDFAREFSAAKAEKRRLDFSDLEHLALRLLVNKTPEGYVRTKQAVDIAARFEHVLVDEYQDTNEVQDLIFTSVSREQSNLFMVGDVKQSIYAFRQAMPEIFLAKRKKFFPYETGFFPVKINLDINFRSRAEVTTAVNYLFGMLMSGQIGDVDYDMDESLKPGAVYPTYGGAKPALMLIPAGERDGETDTTTLEVAEIAGRIRDMLESGYMVNSDDGMRKAMPRDFCVLLRAPKNRADVYVRELSRLGVPAWAESSGGYLAAREVASAICVLKAVDNPLLDIELVAAMTSVFFGFSDDEIAAIRLKARGVPFYTALNLAAETDEKAQDFLRVFHELRSQSAILPADKLIMLFYELTGALSVVRVMPMGESREANLRLLAEYAAEYHRLGYKRLGGFVGFLNRLKEQNRDLAPANTMGSGANVVRVMSIHHSKGLEFPVVFLADTAKKFNRQDLRESTMLHSKYGFACVRRDPVLYKQFPTVPMQAMRLESERATLSEEMRVLYVALTRAREKLVVSAAIKTDMQKKLAGLACGLENGRLAPYSVGEADSYADWILSALLHHTSAAALRELAGADGLELADDGNEWEILVCDKKSEEAEQVKTQVRPQAAPDMKVLAEIERRTGFIYQYVSHTQIPAKLAVSEVVGRESAVRYRFSKRPAFLADRAMTAAEKGAAMHKFMQFADYSAARDDLEAEIDRMHKQRFLSVAEAESINRQKLRKFFVSGLAKRIFASHDVRRELKFMAECGRDELGSFMPELDGGAKIVLQGVADCVFIEDGGAVIVDYKTDYVKEPHELADRYAGQLELYRVILADSIGAPVKQCVIYSFALSSEIYL